MALTFWILSAIVILAVILLLVSARHSEKQLSGANRRSRKQSSWIPENRLEEKLQCYRDKEISLSAFLHTLVASEVYVLSCQEKSADPEHCDSLPGSRGTRLLPVFTSLTQLKKRLKTDSGDYTHAHKVGLRDWLKGIPNNNGLVINPNHDTSVELLLEDVKQLKLEAS